MAKTVQLYQDFRIYMRSGCTCGDTEGRGNSRVNMGCMRLPAYTMREDSPFFNGSVKPLKFGRSKRSLLVCQAVLTPDLGAKIPILKAAEQFFTRTSNALGVHQCVLNMVPAVGVIIFAAWGVVPFMRLCRSIFAQKSDNSWNRSDTSRITTSLLQPVLLWAGVTLMCRSLDPLVIPSVASQAVKQRLLNFLQSLSTVLAFAYCLSSLIQLAQKFFTDSTNDPNDPRNMGFSFAGKAIYTAVWVAAVSLFMELLGYSTQKWLTAGGFGTVLITLAGREIITNFLSSLMIHATRPFVLNEWIQTKIEGYEVSGTVEHVGWWSPTVIRGDDREAVHIPNHKFNVTVVRNLSQKTHWRIKTYIAISHLDVNKINTIVADMRKVLAKNSQVEQQKLHRRVFLENIDTENQALMILISCFVKTSHFEEYLCVKESILLDLLRVVRHHRARLATPIRTVQKSYTDADLDAVPFADSIFPPSRHLLIEPSYRIADDKPKPSPPRQTRATDEIDALESPPAKKDDSLPSEKKVPESDVAVPKKADDRGRPPLEENIVLEVALEGSKRTLPMEDGEIAAASSAESKAPPVQSPSS